MSYCSLEEAFPQLSKDTTRTQPSCWSQNTNELFSKPETEPKVVGAQVSAVIPKTTPTDQQQQQQPFQHVYVVPSFPPQHQHFCQESGHCLTHLQHCLRCPMCFQMLQLYFAQKNQKGAQVATTTSTPQEKPAKKTRSILLEPVFEGSPVTWGTILTLIAGGTLVLLILEIGKRVKQ